MSLSRRNFLQSATVGATLTSLTEFATAAAKSSGAGPARMPSIFIGHGSPINAISDNTFTRRLAAWGSELPKPKAILMVSAHWLTQGATGVLMHPTPSTIHDFSGFPRELHELQYPAKGSPEFAAKAAQLMKSARAIPTTEWGFDHGTWSVLHHMFPKADIPVFQVSIDYARNPAFHYTVGRELSELRDLGVLVAASGNVVHNLRQTDRGEGWSSKASRPWAASFDANVKAALDQQDAKTLVNFHSIEGAGIAAQLPDHYIPLLYALGAAEKDGPPTHVFEGWSSGTLSMRCLQWS